MARKPIMAIMYDFDKTLATTDMQNFGFIPALGLTPEEFWGKTQDFSKATGMERILSYMYMMVKLGKEKGLPMTRKWFKELGANIEYFPGVETWFKRINEYGDKCGVKVEHYLVSSGTKEIVEGSKIAKEFKEIYGCEFYFTPGENGTPIWPKLAINYTQKTQYFFRISKGVSGTAADNKVNASKPHKRIPTENIVYLGDGMTDVPCMILVKQNGGKSIAIFNKNLEQVTMSSLKTRVNFACKADYTENSELEKTVKLIIDRIAVNDAIRIKEDRLQSSGLMKKGKK
ncbi:MAG: haloacid dehalogenase-like hydrolase [Bacilli bacterium]|nr:haloacid dehalogenase-like hydrolase [Bacilli bacterium]